LTAQIGDKMDKNKANVPKIRFPGFNNSWEQRKLGEFLFESLIPGTNGSVANKLTVKLWGKGVVPKNEKYRGSSHTKYYIRHSGQLIYGKLDFLHGAFGIVPEELDGYESTIDAPAFDISRDINHNFLISLILRKEFYLKEGMIANGSRRAKRIHEDTFLKMTPFFPSLQEQNKIGDFFKQLDEAITLHQRKLNHLQDKKKGLLQKMFPKNGEDFPELRFPGFTDPWEQRKLADGTSKIGDGLHGTPKFKDTGDVYFINGNNLVNGNIEITEETKLVSYIEQSDDDKTLDDNTILMSINGTIGNLAWYSGEKIMLGKSAAFIKIRDFNKKYIYYYLQTSTIHEYFFNNLTGTTIKNLGLKTIRETIIDVPSIGEQLKIGQFFEQLDHLITLHQRKLNHLKEQKKSLLQQMFI
jgi:type I restriction enzyme S subunit